MADEDYEIVDWYGGTSGTGEELLAAIQAGSLDSGKILRLVVAVAGERFFWITQDEWHEMHG